MIDLRSDTVTQPTPEMRQTMEDAIIEEYNKVAQLESNGGGQ